MTRLARRLKEVLAVALSAALVLLSPGLEAPRIFAQVVGRVAPVEGVRPVSGFSAAPTAPALGPSFAAPALGAPSLSAASLNAPAPSAISAVPSAAPALAPSATPAASLNETAKALAPQLEAAAKPNAGSTGAAMAGREIDAIVRGEKTAGSGDALAVSGAEGAGAPALGGVSAAAADSEAPKTAVPAAAAPSEGKVVASRISYDLHRSILNMVAKLTGAVYSLPVAGPGLTDSLIASAADKRLVLSDYDDTLAGYNQVLPDDMIAAIKDVRAAGKDFAVISDRGDEKRAHQLTVFESLASIPVELRAGMFVAANSGGRVYRYDEKGEPVRVYEVPALDDASKAKVAEAAEAVKARLHEVGTEQHQPSATNNNPAESWSVYGYAMMLKVGSSQESVVKAAEMLQDELAARGMKVEVSPRFAKDPANPPYINFSIVTKAPAAEYIAKALKAAPSEVLVIGDSQYAPHRAKKDSWLTRLGAKLSGRAIPATGNQTDRNMEKGAPGALTLSVGTTGDPRASNLWVLSGKGPSVTRRVLEAVASKPAAPGSRSAVAAVAEDGKPVPPKGQVETERLGGLAAVGLAIAILTAVGAAYYGLIHGLVELLQQWEREISEGARQGWDGAMMLGGAIAAGTLHFGATARLLPNPADAYAAARKQAVDAAAKRGVAPEAVRFVQATASMPVSNGQQWHYSFEIPGKNGGSALIYADAETFMGGEPSFKVTIFDGVSASVGSVAHGLEPVHFKMGAKIGAEGALDIARRAQPGMSAGVSVALDYREEKVSGDKDLWYKFYDDKGAIVSVNARTGEARVDSAIPTKPSKDGGNDGFFREMLLGFGGLAVVMAIYYAIFWAATHAGTAASSDPVPVPSNAGWEGLFGGVLGGWGISKWFQRSSGPKAYDERFPNLKASVSPASPIEGLSSFVYDEGLRAAREHAASIGYDPERVGVTGATVWPRAWGEDVTFSFVSPREGYDKAPRLYDVTVRRTMVSETMVDAIKVSDLGRTSLFTSVRADAFKAAVRVAPMDIVAKSGPDARSMGLQARWTGPNQAAEMWYVLRDSKGKEIAAYNAATGALDDADPNAFWKKAGVGLLLFAAVAAIYGAIFYAIGHAPAASSGVQVPEGWQGPVPSDMSLDKVFGGVLGFLGLAGTIKKVSGKKAAPKVSNDEIEAAAKSVVSNKGGIWSETEYNMAYANVLAGLEKRGATKAQLKRFRALCDAAPVIGGRFNPWSGD